MQQVEPGKKKRFTTKEWSWIMYDWANSVYATNIMAAIFPIIFVNIAGKAGDIWWGYATSIATFLISILAPLLGAVADYRGMKKKLFTGFMLAGVLLTAAIAFTNDWRIMLVTYILSRIGFAGSNLFYDSFLTDVTTNERMDKVSSWGYAMGYIGGSTIPFVLSIVMLLVLGYGSPVAQKFSILITSVWWLVFSLPFLKNVEQEHYIERSSSHTIAGTFRNILSTAQDILQRKGLFLFVIAYFFYIDGVGTIISVSTAYGTVLGLGTVGMILALLVTQIVAVPCSILFSQLAAKITARKALIGAILLYIFICVVGFYMGYSLEPHQEAFVKANEEYSLRLEGEEDAFALNLQKQVQDLFVHDQAAQKLAQLKAGLTEEQASNAQALAVLDAGEAFLTENQAMLTDYRAARSLSTLLFWAMAFMVGTVQGGIQAVSRSYFGKLIPKERSNEFFGFFDIFGKFASVLGPFLYSLMGGWTGRSSYGVLCLIALFLIGLGIMIFGKKQLETLDQGA